MATTKEKENNTPIDDEFLKSMKGVNNSTSNFVTNGNIITSIKIDDKDLKPLPQTPNVSICVNPEVKETWKRVFKSMDLTLAQGIRKAVDYYIIQLKNGNINL